MPKIILTLIALWTLTACSQPDTPDVPLQFFVISEHPSPDTQAVNVERLKVAGFARSEPDMIIYRLAAVMIVAPSESYMVDENGKATELPKKHNIMIELKPDELTAFTNLTQAAVDKRILIQLGNTSISAPFVREPIRSPSVQITIGTDEREAQNVAKLLSKLVD